MKVSVIVPVYGVEQYIERCACSLFEQTMLEDIEFIFVDDASPDGSIKRLFDVSKKYHFRSGQINVVRHGVNRGVAAARNTGLKASKGEYVVFCDSDDWVAPDMYESLCAEAEHTHADMVVCDFWGVYGKRKILYHQTPDVGVREYMDLIISGQLHNSLWNKMIKRSVYDRLDFVFTEGVDLCEDASVLCRLVYFVDRIAMVSKPLYSYAQNISGSYTKKCNRKAIDDIIRSFGIVSDFYENLLEDDYGQHIKWVRTRALIGCLSHSTKRDLDFVLDRFKDISSADIDALNLPLHKKIETKLMLNGKYSTANFLNYTISRIKAFVR